MNPWVTHSTPYGACSTRFYALQPISLEPFLSDSLPCVFNVCNSILGQFWTCDSILNVELVSDIINIFHL